MTRVLWLIATVAEATTHEAFVAWATSSGCTFGPVKVAASGLGGGVGMFTTADVDPGEILFAVPRRLNIGLDAALCDPECGADFENMANEGGAMSVLCTFIAKQHLCNEAMGPYLATLPELRPTTDCVQHWTPTEVEAFAGTAAHRQANEIRAEAAEAVEDALELKSLRQCLEQVNVGVDRADLEAVLTETVRGAHAAILSRSFAVEGDDPGDRELIPLLDILQHVEPPSIEYRVDWMPRAEGGGALEPCTVALAKRTMAAGEEIYNSYGDHPGFVFATHFGFVPGAGSAADVAAATASEAGECWACELTIGGGGEAASRIGPSIVLAAQLRASQMFAAGKYAYGPTGGDEDDDVNDDDEDEDDEADVQFTLASRLLEAQAWAAYPLRFIITNEALTTAAASAAAATRPTNEQGADTLLTCARLCTLDFSQLESLPEAADVDDPNEQLDAALHTLLFSPRGRLSLDNDHAAAELLEEAARQQLDAPPRVASGDARSECVALAEQTRATEAVVLRRLIDGGARAMFGL